MIVHDHAVREPGTLGFAIVNIYKLENGKVVDLGRYCNQIPEKPANNNGMLFVNSVVSALHLVARRINSDGPLPSLDAGAEDVSYAPGTPRAKLESESAA